MTMAESVALSFATFVVKSLGGFLIEEANNLRGVRPQVEQLQAQLNQMQCFLEAADARPKGGADEIIIRNCVAEIREASYDAEAAIATFVVKIAFRTSGRSDQFPFVLKRNLCIFKECLARREVRLEIEAINTRITNSLTTGFQTCGILNSTEVGESSSSTSMAERKRQLRRSYTHIVEEDVVGTEEDVKAIVDLLVKEKARYRVVSIWGMGGLGKTTLAMSVYKHIEIKRHFNKCVAWACISQQCNAREVLVEILIKLLSPSKEERKEIEKLKHDELVKKLHQVQSEKKCLVILDDIWKDADWDSLSPGFPNTTEVGSKILLTTRNENVAKHVDQQCVLYKLRHLTEKESWELFEKKTLLRRNEDTDPRVLDTNMEALGREMIKLCAGLPFAIIEFGRLLAREDTLREWEMVYQDVCLNKWSDDPKQHYNGVSEVLALSYHDLPNQLKLCFLYFGHFSEDFEIDAERLYNLWIADNIIVDADRVGDETIIDVANRYLGALAQRCMVQVQVEEYTQKINYCRINLHMLDLCLSEATRHNFLRIIHLQPKTDLTNYFSTTLTASTLKIRKLAIHLNRDVKRVVLPDLETTKQLRSILFYNSRHDQSLIELNFNFKYFKLLRNLDLEGFKLDEKLVKSIGSLICLRYLSFRRCFILKWHLSICKLKYLKTLDLRGCNFNLGEEIVLHSMEGLRHLFISLNLNFINKFKLDGLRKLETFEGFNTWNCDVNDLFKLINLQQLKATFSETENSEDFGAFLDYISADHLRQTSLSVYFSFEEEKLTILKQLLGCHHLYKLSVFGFIIKLPKYQDFSSSIIKLQLCSCNLQEDPMPTLERLPRLQFLNLDFDAFVGDKMVCSDNGFPQLKTLQLHCLKHLKEWEVEIGALPNLTVLAIHYCQGLEMVPEGLRFIATLQQFTIQEMSEKFNNKLRGVNGEEGEDFYKVRHVSYLDIL